MSTDNTTPEPAATPDPHVEPTAPAPYTAEAAAPVESKTFSLLGIIFGAIAVLFFPILFGIAAIVMAIIAKNKHEKLANIALIVAIAGTVLGFIVGAAVNAAVQTAFM